MLIDIGVNLTNPRLYHEHAKHKAEAQAVGIGHQIITGTCLATSQKAAQLCENDLAYYSATAGCHPHDAKDFIADHLQQLEQLLCLPQVVAVGECGLDFNRNFSPPDKQIAVFRQQIELAIKTQMPLFMHQRDAHLEFLEILRPYHSKLAGGVVHCFTGNAKELGDYLDMGFYIGITGWLCDERRGGNLRDAVIQAPVERLLLETDAPYLLPRTIRPKPKSRTNVPANLPWILHELANILNLDPEELTQITTKNCQQLFKLVR